MYKPTIHFDSDNTVSLEDLRKQQHPSQGVVTRLVTSARSDTVDKARNNMKATQNEKNTIFNESYLHVDWSGVQYGWILRKAMAKRAFSISDVVGGKFWARWSTHANDKNLARAHFNMALRCSFQRQIKPPSRGMPITTANNWPLL